MHLYVFDGGTVADALQGQAIDFIVRASDQSALGDTNVAQCAGIVGRVVAAVHGNVRAAFALDVTDLATAEAGPGATLSVLRGKALDDDATPFAQPVEVVIERLLKVMGCVAVPSASSMEPRVTSRVPVSKARMSVPGSMVRVTPLSRRACTSARLATVWLPSPTVTVPSRRHCTVAEQRVVFIYCARKRADGAVIVKTDESSFDDCVAVAIATATATAAAVITTTFIDGNVHVIAIAAAATGQADDEREQ